MLAGAVLEDGLRRLLLKVGETVKTRDDLSAMNARCAQKQLYNRLVQKKSVSGLTFEIMQCTDNLESTTRRTSSAWSKGSTHSLRTS